mgnify:CR=1 FL=1
MRWTHAKGRGAALMRATLAPATLALAALALSGCNDTGGGGTVILGGGDAGGGLRSDGSVLLIEDAQVGDGGVTPTPDAAPPSDGSAPVTDAAPMGECSAGQVRCVEEGQAFRQVCRDDRRWAVERCADDELCADGLCVPNPGDCVAGERGCLTADTPGICMGDAGWQAQESCGEGQICSQGFCTGLACAEAASNNSYLGCDYMAVDLPNAAFSPGVDSTPDAPIGVVVANPDFVETVSVTIDGPNGMPAQLVASRRIAVPADPEIQRHYQATTVHSEVRDADGMVVAMDLARADAVDVPPGGIATFLLPNGGGPSIASHAGREAYRVRTDRPVAAYQFSPYCCNYSFSNDASLLFPVTALGTDYRFLGVPTFAGALGASHFPGSMVVVGTEDATQVDIALPRNGNITSDPAGRVRNQNGRVSVRLDAQEVLVLNTDSTGFNFGAPPNDLSGARLTSDKPVAVFSAHHCTNYPELLGACDHLQEQLFPTGTWGTTYVLVPPPERGRDSQFELIYWKILARDAGTTVTLSGAWNEIGARGPGFSGVPDCGTMLGADRRSIVLQGEGFCEFGTREPLQIIADAPIMVMGIISGQQATGLPDPFSSHAGDPAIFLVPPDQQYRNDYVFLVPDTYFADYVTVTLDADTQLMLDGEPVALGDVLPIPGSTRVFKHIAVSDGPHRLQANRPFGILVVAFDDFVSYAFTGGLNLRKR